MAYCLFSTTTLPKPMLIYCHLTLRNNLQWNQNHKITIFIQEHYFENIICQMVVILFQPPYVEKKTRLEWTLIRGILWHLILSSNHLHSLKNKFVFQILIEISLKYICPIILFQVTYINGSNYTTIFIHYFQILLSSINTLFLSKTHGNYMEYLSNMHMTNGVFYPWPPLMSHMFRILFSINFAPVHYWQECTLSNITMLNFF